MTWYQLLANWALIENDLYEVYGIDVHDRDLMRSRSWAWLQRKIYGLLNRPPRVHFDGALLPTTRLGWHLNPPKSSDES